jgi:outer membrane protein assembly factor BamB
MMSSGVSQWAQRSENVVWDKSRIVVFALTQLCNIQNSLLLGRKDITVRKLLGGVFVVATWLLLASRDRNESQGYNFTMTSDSISPDITSTIAIPAIYAKDSTFNSAGRDQTFITNIYTVDPNCNQGIWNNHPATQTHQSSRKNLPVVVCRHPIYKLS